MISIGSYGAIQGAKTADSTMATSIRLPMTNSTLLRAKWRGPHPEGDPALRLAQALKRFDGHDVLSLGSTTK